MRKNENAWKNAMYNYSRFFVVCLVAFAMVFMSYPYSLYAAETASDTIVQEAKNESELLLSLRTALWLRYMDVRNTYTNDYKAWISSGKVGAEPTPPGEFNTFTLSGLTGTYLPDSFPISDYSIATQGKELVLSKNISTATANIVPNFIPLAQITPATAEDSTVEFFVSRPGATAEFDMEEYVWKDRANTMASPATLEWENWDADLGAKTGVESFIAVNKTFLRTIEGANGSILSFGAPGVTSLTGDLDIANTLTATDGTFTTLQAATMNLTGDMDIDGTLTVANVDIQNKILSDMTLANDKEIKLDEGAVRLKASGTDLSVNNNEGYITMGRHGTQARFDTNADEFYFGKNIRVARLLGKADFASHADHADSASAADSFGGRDKTSWESYIQNTAKSAGESPVIQTGTWYVNNSSNASNMKGSICAGGHNKRIYQAPNKNGYWYSLANLRGSVFFPAIPVAVDSSVISNVRAVTVTIRLSGTWESGSVAKVYRRKKGETNNGTLIVNKSMSAGGSWCASYTSFTMVPGYEYKFDCYMTNMCRESYDDGYGMAMYATKVVMGAKFK